jgi:5-methyltetrahydrofolate--homocysteine methyltransferase
LSGLLVKSAQQMVVTANDLRDAGVTVPLLVGGAALSEKYTTGKIAPTYTAPTFYAKDAMTGLRLMNEIMDPVTREGKLAAATFSDFATLPERDMGEKVDAGTTRSSKVRVDFPIPSISYLDRRVRTLPQLNEIWGYINPYMLFGRHMGYKGNFEKQLLQRDEKALSLFNDMEAVKEDALTWMKVRAVWQFFEAERDGNSIRLFEPGARDAIHTFHFARQPRKDGLCLSDYVLEPANGRRDHIALFVVTAGEGVRERAEAAKNAGEFFKAHAIQALAIESAEGCAEYVHRRLREDWGFPDPPSMTMQERFTSRYRGKRYSFGYPACPNLDDQQGIWKLINPDDIGVELTEGMMMEPEASVSALVFHHPDCAYFTASDDVEAAAAGD